MERTPTRCGYCGLRTVTRAGRCPSCGHEKHPPKVMEPAPPPRAWQAPAGQIAAAAALTLLTIVAAILVGSQVLLFLAILVLCALGVLFVVANGTS